MRAAETLRNDFWLRSSVARSIVGVIEKEKKKNTGAEIDLLPTSASSSEGCVRWVEGQARAGFKVKFLEAFLLRDLMCILRSPVIRKEGDIQFSMTSDDNDPGRAGTEMECHYEFCAKSTEKL